ncbi:alkaline phosphatase family protein [Algoriphagus marinus]|uniref:alkaline phosphatase family protein n=1 Tax=Algoriphagus marinus TaxID=1925762 RepID=UPI00094B9118|nr:alkaline phosphatase family protein [Algoriphagus marinus]
MSFKSALILCLMVSLMFFSNQAFAQKKAVFIILDGIPADVLEKTPTPNLDKIAKVGGYTRAYTGGEVGGYSETPTISAVGYNSLLTGTWANKHNVWGNDIKAPNYSYWSIFRFLRKSSPSAKLGIYSTWEDNRTKLIGEGLAETGFFKMDFSFDGFEVDTLTYPHDSDKKYIQKIDNLVSYEAAYQLKTIAPDLSWVYLEYTDDMGHRFGDSPELAEAVALADEQVGRIYESIRYREEKFGEEWLILITTDHGRKAEDGKDHGGQSDREREIWMVTNAKELNPYFENFIPAMVDILPTIARFLEIDLPENALKEIDGVSLIGDISLVNANTEIENEQIKLTWVPIQKSGKVTISYASTDNFGETGNVDNYSKIAEIDLSAAEFRFPIAELPPGKLKFWIQGERNGIGVWLIR